MIEASHWLEFEPLLRTNGAVYERFIERSLRKSIRSSDDLVLNGVRRAASFAEAFHTGRFADGHIENMALALSTNANPRKAATDTAHIARSGARRRLLHVLTRAARIGGHTRFVHQWIRNDSDSHHSVVILEGNAAEIPSGLTELVQSRGGSIRILPTGMTLLAGAAALRQMAAENVDLVVLSHHGHDVRPIVAFGGLDTPPVAVVNHADHVFWLGSSITDTVISLRSNASSHVQERRFVERGVVLPIPLSDRLGEIGRDEARRRLNIAGNQIALVSVGREMKYRPCGGHDFVATANRILKRYPQAAIYVVGPSPQDILPYLRVVPHERLHFTGATEDVLVFLRAADIYLESFPFGSNTALLEAALSALPVVPAYAPLFDLLVAGNDSLLDLLENLKTEKAYIERVGELIEREDLRQGLGWILRERLLGSHVGEAWQEHLAAVYRHTDPLTHRTREIQAGTLCTSQEDISLSLWNAMLRNTNGCINGGRDRMTQPDVLRYANQISQWIGDYSCASRYALRAVLAESLSPGSCVLLAQTLLGGGVAALRAAAHRA